MRKFLVWFVLYYLRFWAKITLKLHRPYIIGIAGSVGKSSTRNALYAVLKDHFKTKVVSGNSETGVPLGILGLKLPAYKTSDWLKVLWYAPRKINNLKNTQYLIVEMGIDDPHPPKNMEYLLSIVKPDMAIDLNVTATHTMQFEILLTRNIKDSLTFLLKKIAEEDSKIITKSGCKVAIYNADDENLVSVIDKAKNKLSAKLLTFGKGKENSLRLTSYEITPKKTKFTYSYESKKGEREIILSFANMILPPAYQETFASVILACQELGLSHVQIKEDLENNFHLPHGRSSILTGIKNSMLIDSTYNSSKESVLSFLEMLKILKEKTDRQIIFVMGDMRELGSESEGEHAQVAKELIKVVDWLYCVGANTQEFVLPIVKEAVEKKHGTIKKVEWYKNAIQLGLHLKEELTDNSIILFKGSQNEIFLEEAVKFLLLNPNDTKYLARQDEYWMRLKQEHFSV
jgi:UDP-N-acetylmuramoyl-tripeptide--D-alanyl-D-alanine ligase